MIPEGLKKGDKVALVATAKPVTKKEMKPFLDLMKTWGLEVIEGKFLYDTHHHFASTDENRAKDFEIAWTDESIKAVFCARGGYGSIRMLKHLPKDLFKTKKWLIGYSDITTLHLCANRHGLSSIHGPMALNVFNPNSQTNANFKQLKTALFEGNIEVDCSKSEIINPAAFKGELIGGNLSLLAASMGTAEQPKSKGKVLFIEEIDEYLYHFDRILQSMDRTGMFKNLAALIIGGVSKMKDNEVKFGQSAKEIVTEICAPYGFPIVFDFPAGHAAKNSTISLGTLCKFDNLFLRQNLK